MNHCLFGLSDSMQIPYLDDILCYDKLLHEHLESLPNILKRQTQFGVKLREEKL